MHWEITFRSNFTRFSERRAREDKIARFNNGGTFLPDFAFSLFLLRHPACPINSVYSDQLRQLLLLQVIMCTKLLLILCKSQRLFVVLVGNLRRIRIMFYVRRKGQIVEVSWKFYRWKQRSARPKVRHKKLKITKTEIKQWNYSLRV